MLIKYILYQIIIISCLFTALTVHSFTPNETPATPGEWGFHPTEGDTLQVTPPPFTWRPQENAQYYEIQCSQNQSFDTIDYEVTQIEFSVHTPPTTLASGQWHWRFRFVNQNNETSAWSNARSFKIVDNANELPLPAKGDLIARIPDAHPRIFVRPEQIPELRQRAQGDLKPYYDALVNESEKLLQNPPDTTEPPTYPDEVEYKSEEWREIWWGNRTYTIRALNGAATLAFTYLLDGNKEYGNLAKTILMNCADWDPTGATGFKYNDEAGMPYNYYFSRTYTFINDLLTDAEKAKCREVMQVRGNEMYNHLHPRHLWRPYSSHSNRSWHFLGEVGIAFLDEIPEAQQWVWFAANVFTNVYPVWSDSDGGWHEGVSYWRSYIDRFTWWADIMNTAMGINAFDKPYFSEIGYYPMYLQPPGTQGGGFGDLTAQRNSEDNTNLMAVLAAQAQNPHWQWYVDQHGGGSTQSGYIGFIRGALPKVTAKAPTDLPTSRLFAGTGQAMLNHTLLNAQDNVEVIFKSSPFGTQSHGYESNNSFLLYAFGERLLIRSGRRDIYGSEHHQNWMWHTKSTNCITVNGESQIKHSAAAQGDIIEFQTTELFDYVAGEAASAYDKNVLDQFTRRILFIKPNTVLIVDSLKAPEPSSFEWHLHAPTQMTINNQHAIEVQNNKANCQVNFLWPKSLNLEQTDQFDPPPRPRVKLVEYHLTATPQEKTKEQTFITVLQPFKEGEPINQNATLEETNSGFKIQVPLTDKEAVVWVNENQTEQSYQYQDQTINTSAFLTAAIFDNDNKVQVFQSEE